MKMCLIIITFNIGCYKHLYIRPIDEFCAENDRKYPIHAKIGTFLDYDATSMEKALLDRRDWSIRKRFSLCKRARERPGGSIVA